MKKGKRFFAIVLVAVLAFSSLGTHVLLAEENEAKENEEVFMDFTIDEDALKALAAEADALLQEAMRLVEEREEALARGSLDDTSFVTRDEIGRLSESDFEYLYNFMITENPTQDQLIQEMKRLANGDGGRSFGIWPDGKLQPNVAEVALIATFPHHGVVYITMSQRARDAALRIYTEGSTWWSGNGDAYRHVIWNVYLYDAFSPALATIERLPQSREIRVKMFTDAHEHGQSDIHSQMDVLNNALGLMAAPVWLSVPQPVEMSTERFIDIGGAWRVQNFGFGDHLVRTCNSEKIRWW